MVLKLSVRLTQESHRGLKSICFWVAALYISRHEFGCDLGINWVQSGRKEKLT